MFYRQPVGVSMKVGDLVHFIEPRCSKWAVREDTSGIVLGFHPKNSWKVQVLWFDMGSTPTPDGPGYWRQSSLKVHSETR